MHVLKTAVFEAVLRKFVQQIITLVKPPTPVKVRNVALSIYRALVQ